MRWSIILLGGLSCASGAAAATEPTFATRQDYGGGGTVQVADLNGDHIPDIVSLKGFSILPLLGNGDGTFHAAPTTQPGFAIGSGVAVDLNDDGYADLVMSGGPNGAAWGIGISMGQGDGTFSPAVFYQTGKDSIIGCVVVGDFNGDGVLDVLTTGESGVWLFIGRGAGVFEQGVLTPIQGIQAAHLVAADFNGDGDLDVAISILSPTASGFIVLFGNGDGTFQSAITYNSMPRGPHWVSAGDVNGDGHIDIAVAPDVAGVSSIYIYLNNGHGRFSAPIEVTMPGPAAFVIADVNGDDIPDLVNGAGCVELGLGQAQFASPVCYPVESSGPVSVALGDLRHDGLTDIVAGETLALSVLLNAGSGTFADGRWVSIAGAGDCGAAADFNGDGRPDLAVPTSAGITVLLGTGKRDVPYAIGPSFAVVDPGCPISGDLNGDGIADLVLGSSSGVASYLGNGDGTFTLAGVVPLNPGVLALGDFNHDGKLDVADSSNQLALGNGDGSFQAPVSIVANPPVEGFSWLAAGDVNSDGWTDLVVTNWDTTSSIYILVNNKEGGFKQNVIRNVDGPLTVTLADLNGDGNLDAVIELFFTGTAAIYLGNGHGGFTLKETIGYGGSYPSPPAVGFVNGDDIPDIVLPADGSVGIWVGNGDGTFQPPLVYYGTGPAQGQILFERLHGQHPRSGLEDIVEPDATGGVTVLANTTK